MLVLLITTCLCSPSGAANARNSAAERPRSAAAADLLVVVHCLLPGQVRQLGQRTTYVSPRRPVRTSALDCRVRGGEYVLAERANLKNALGVWLGKAKEGNPEAQTTVGEIFEAGLGVPPDFAAAKLWYEKAAQQDYSSALINLGNLYERGWGTQADPERALQLYRRAAGLDDRDAQIPEHAYALEPTADVAEATLTSGNGRPLRVEPAQTGETLDSTLPAQVRVAGPTITLVDPLIPAAGATRGLVKVSLPGSARLASTIKRIVGRVVAPAGLLTLSINDQPVETNTAGVFVYRVGPAAGGPIEITAIDQRGERTDLSLQFAKQQPVRPSTRPLPDLGAFHALLIANSKYRHLSRLETPPQDVARLEALLKHRYGFKVRVLYDADRYTILSALNELRAKLTPDDNLLVYYAGHGDLDRKNMRGHWLPIDAEPDNTANWISNVAVTDLVNVIRARHVMLVVDSCYSGTLTRSSVMQLQTGMTADERQTWLRLLAEKRSRVVLTSGGLAPVLDFGGGEHSVFASAFLQVLEENSDLLVGRLVYQAVAARVAHQASTYEFEQIPAYAPIARAGHEAGDFLFRPIGASN